jgi:hypothetical protein
MGIELNTQAQVSKVSAEVKRILSEIATNAMRGVAITEIRTPLETQGKVRTQLTQELKEGNTNFTFMTIRSAPNPYTGRMEYFSGETIGDLKVWRLKILS